MSLHANTCRSAARTARAAVVLLGLLFLLSACGGSRSADPLSPPGSAAAGLAQTNTLHSEGTGRNAPDEWEREQMAKGAQLNAQELNQAARPVGDSPASVPDVAVERQATYRLYNTQTGAHFFTTSIVERDDALRNTSAFQYEGIAFYTSATQAAGLLPVHRFFGLDTGVHFYTISEAEKVHIETNLPRLRYEGVAYYASPVGSSGVSALTRFYVPSRGIHFYTADAGEAVNIRTTNPLYAWEGLSYYVWTSNDTPPTAPTNGSTQVTALPDGFAACADSSIQTLCNFDGIQQLHFGVAGRYFTAAVSGPFDCATAAYTLGDPAPGEIKQCFVEASAINPVETPSAPPPTSTPSSAARIAQVALAQSMVFPSDDAQLVLVEGKDVLVLAKVTTTNTQEVKPDGFLTVENSAGQPLYSIALTPPTGAIPASLKSAPSFSQDYSARLPGSWVKAGLRLKVGLNNGLAAINVAPRVGASNAITLVAIPIQIGSKLATVPADSTNYLRARMPMASVEMPQRAPMVSTSVTAMPTTDQGWLAAMQNLLGEIADIRVSEYAQRNAFYYGFFPKSSYGYMGLGYVGYQAAVGADWAYKDLGLQTLVHELGHNTGLPHAPCGGPSNPDPDYPYANAALGAGSRYIWGYSPTANTFTDPTNSALHDTMSYCTGDTFSDYNYRKIQVKLTPADADLHAEALNKRSERPQELLLISGRLKNDALTLRPPKSFRGIAQPPSPGPYRLRMVSTDATVTEHDFSGMGMDHDTETLAFAFSVAHPGSLQALEIWRGEQLLLRQASAPGAAKSGQPQRTLLSKSTGAGQAPTGWQIKESTENLHVSWDAKAWPYLMVTHIGTQRTTLVVDARGGELNLALKDLPSGGTFEFSASDGLNSQRWEQQR